jgi:hypothetical protein
MTEYQWYDLGNGRRRYAPAPKPMPARSDLPCPYLSLDTIQPTISMADGKEYTSKSALRATYKANGNPQGVDYIEVGNESLARREKPVRDDAKAIEAIERAEADIIAGRAPEIGKADADVMAVAKMIEV